MRRAISRLEDRRSDPVRRRVEARLNIQKESDYATLKRGSTTVARKMPRRWKRSSLGLTIALVALLVACPTAGFAQSKYECMAAANPPKLPVTRPSGRFGSAPATVRVQLSAKIADTWKPSLKEIGSVPAGTTVEVLEDMIVVDGPDIVRVTGAVAGLDVKEGDTILRYARLGEGSSDFWTGGCLYKDANSEFIVEPDGGGCGGSDCSAKVTKMGKQKWWIRIRLPDGRVGWTLSIALDL